MGISFVINDKEIDITTIKECDLPPSTNGNFESIIQEICDMTQDTVNKYSVIESVPFYDVGLNFRSYFFGVRIDRKLDLESQLNIINSVNKDAILEALNKFNYNGVRLQVNNYDNKIKLRSVPYVC